MEKLSAQESTHQKFIEAANRRKILSHKCTNCGHLMLETVLFCEKCSGSKFEHAELEGTGTVVTYTIQAVAPEGFEDAGSYAWVVFKIDNSQLRASGFLPGIKTPAELPIGTRVRVAGFDPKHGLMLKK
ncbi:MAG: nucleotide-binding protein [Thaumarchaeota archaeon 13_1_40CM_3_50_5]|nr:MAG: nucleotide-binding protein [Thaumarchaeota archaeon 13_1_40CM_4_48_7]OLC84879.1 MAG: nucleotide-binding protein [Thaumarchaeota archaeon 13_1_40CM_3_50_5]